MRNLFTLTALIFATHLLTAQNWLEGYVRDAETRQPLEDVWVALPELKTGAVTNELGYWRISIPANKEYQLEFRYFGYRSKTITVSETTSPEILLEPDPLKLDAVTLTSSRPHNQQLISRLDIGLRPILNSQEILRMVPGLIMGQHAGGGKAEQIFLRGFDIDHGTDIRITVDGMPVNMVSHAHGQGYADLHFVIPELVEKINFQKGGYQASQGNFSTAGWVDFRTRETLDRSFVKLEGGQFNTYRGLAAVNLFGSSATRHSAYLASEYQYSDSYFDNPQFFNRLNLQGRYTGQLSDKSRLSVTASHFWSRWNHSGQIPDRAVASGLISFFGSIDPTEGGETSRSNVNAELVTQTGKDGLLKNQVFYTNYQFELFSNFTFFLNDPVNGDQIRQRENRNLFGYNGSYSLPGLFRAKNSRATLGVQVRQDLVADNELANSLNRTETRSQIQFGDVNELNFSVFAEEDIALADRLHLNAGFRYDFFRNQYLDRLPGSTGNSQTANAGILSPKLNLYFTPNPELQLYLNTGRSFHSNDTRVAVPQNGRDVLPASYGSDLGVNWKPVPRLLINSALWYLWLEQEFVYVGDAGVVEPSGRSQRYGVDLSARYQLTRVLFADFDVNWTRPRAVDEAAGEDFIPLAPVFTSVGGLTLRSPSGFNGSIRYRYVGDRPANEDNSIVAEGYFVTDLQLNYTRPRYEIGLNVQNLFNTEWKETQFATESRLFDETEPVEEIHFTPGTPFFARLALTLFIGK